jgi:hypothetical protein
VGASAVDASAVDASAVGASAVDAPAVDASAVDAPAVDASAVDASAVGASAVDAPAVDAPAVDARAEDGSAREGQATAAPVDLELVQRSWPAVLDAVKDRSRRLHAFLTPGRPVAISSEALTVAFGAGSSFHAEQCGNEEWQGAFSDVFSTVLGAPLRIRCTVTDGDDTPQILEEDEQDVAAKREAEAVLETEYAEAAGDLPDEREAHQRAVDVLTRDLGAVVVEE